MSRSTRRNFAVFSFYTPLYAEGAKRLSASLDALRIPHEIEPLPDTGDWVKNCAMKPEFILRKWLNTSARVVWVDADAVIHSEPYLFTRLDTDMAAHWRSDKRYTNELLSGTLFFNRTDGARRILQAWTKRMSQVSDEWDQRTLADIVHGMENISLYRLPASYTQIFDTMADRGKPVIEHFQRSRQVKNA